MAKFSESHHRIRDFSVQELHRVNEPLSPQHISTELNLPLEEVNPILDDLDKGKIFICRKNTESVHWAYPVTADATPHHLSHSSGERGDGA